MSLKKCKACGHEVSSNADKCPNCGEPQKRKTVGCLGGIGVIVLVFAVVAAFESTQTTDITAPTPAPAPKITADCALQDGRKDAIQKLINKGLFQKTSYGQVTKVWVMPIFVSDATLDDKKAFISVVSAYDVCNGGDGRVVIFDAINGEELGSFTEYGLDWDG